MKKLLFTVVAMLAFVACSDDKDPNQLPVEDLKLPEVVESQLFKAGEELTIQGKGFTELSEIWFKAVASATRVDEAAVKAEVKSVEGNALIIIAPKVYGKQAVSLKQNDKFFPLGELTFAPEPQVLTSTSFNLTYSGKDPFGPTFTYNAANQVEKVMIDYSFFAPAQLEVKVYYDESQKINRITTQRVGMKNLMADGIVTYKSATEVSVNMKGSKERFYTLDEKGRTITVKDSRADKVEKFVYNEQGNIAEYIETFDKLKPEVTKFTYDDQPSMFAKSTLPDWAWHFMLVDVSPNVFIRSLYSVNNAVTVNADKYTYTVNEAGQPIEILLNGAKLGTASYK